MVLGDDDGVGLDGLDDFPSEQQVVHLGVGRLALRGERERGRILVNGIDALHEHAAVDGAQLDLRMGSGAAGLEHAQLLALGQALLGLLGIGRGDEHLHELLVLVSEVLHELQRDLAIAGDDAAERALGIACERAVIGGHDVVGRSGTAGVLVLQDDNGRLIELAHRVPSGIGVEQVVVRERLAAEQLGTHQRVLGRGKAAQAAVELVDGSGLMRVLAVA